MNKINPYLQVKALSESQKTGLLNILKTRFEQHTNRHKELVWSDIESRLKTKKDKLMILYRMESSGGEPDVIQYDSNSNTYRFFDCSAESPKERRSLCYDRDALDARKEFKPAGNAVDLAAAIGIEILTEEQYRFMQQFGAFDTKTSSWLKTPEDIRKLGGAICGDRRYNHVFVSHNGAQSYYAARGFRGCLSV